MPTFRRRNTTHLSSRHHSLGNTTSFSWWRNITFLAHNITIKVAWHYSFVVRTLLSKRHDLTHLSFGRYSPGVMTLHICHPDVTFWASQHYSCLTNFNRSKALIKKFSLWLMLLMAHQMLKWVDIIVCICNEYKDNRFDTTCIKSNFYWRSSHRNEKFIDFYFKTKHAFY